MSVVLKDPIIADYDDLSEISSAIADLRKATLPVLLFLEGSNVSVAETRNKINFLLLHTRKQVLGIVGPHMTKKELYYWAKVQSPINSPLVEDLDQLRAAIGYVEMVGKSLQQESVSFQTVGYSQGSIIGLFNQIRNPEVFKSLIAINPGIVEGLPFLPMPKNAKTQIFFSEHDEITSPAHRQELATILRIRTTTIAGENHGWSEGIAKRVVDTINHHPLI